MQFKSDTVDGLQYIFSWLRPPVGEQHNHFQRIQLEIWIVGQLATSAAFRETPNLVVTWHFTNEEEEFSTKFKDLNSKLNFCHSIAFSDLDVWSTPGQQSST